MYLGTGWWAPKEQRIKITHYISVYQHEAQIITGPEKALKKWTRSEHAPLRESALQQALEEPVH